jgi:hypothetical protein
MFFRKNNDLSELYSVTIWKTVLFIVSAVRTSNLTPCNLGDTHQCFRGTCSLRLQAIIVCPTATISFTLKMEALVPVSQSIGHHIPEGSSTLYIRHHENLISHLDWCVGLHIASCTGRFESDKFLGLLCAVNQKKEAKSGQGLFQGVVPKCSSGNRM